MDIKTLIDQYFDSETDITIDAFDFDNIYNVYHRIISKLSSHFEIEISVMQGLSYCFYEILDNVLTHSGKKSGVAITSFNPSNSALKVLIADDGMGICNSLKQNKEFESISERDALKFCIKESFAPE